MNYIELMQRELIPAFGCTEPIALAFTAGTVRKIMKNFPEKIVVRCSGNMIKNAKSVIIPNSDGKKGIEYSAILGTIVGKPELKLEILESVTADDIKTAEKLYANGFCSVELAPNVENLYIDITGIKGTNKARVIVSNEHTNIIHEELNGKILMDKSTNVADSHCSGKMSFMDIYNFALNENIDAVRDIIELEIKYNSVIAQEGLKNNWGSNIAKLFAKNDGKFLTIAEEAQAFSAAGSDARMSGCALPVVINSGSGNQGMTVSLPIIRYAKHYSINHEKLIRSLVFANLIGLYLKSGIGKLSAYCGVVSAASASAAGIAFMLDESTKVIEETLSNSLASLSGIICDGAKPSCAMKIATAVGTSLLAYKQAKTNNSFKNGDGIVKDTIDHTISAVSKIAKDGMKETDIVILKTMLETGKCVKMV